MNKFDSWNRDKQQLHGAKPPLYYYPREIWWCALGVNIGAEEDGTGKRFDRPVLILKKLSRDTSLVVPLTTSPSNHPMRPDIGTVKEKKARAILSQVRVVDAKRLLRKIYVLDKERFKEIRKKVKAML